MAPEEPNPLLGERPQVDSLISVKVTRGKSFHLGARGVRRELPEGSLSIVSEDKHSALTAPAACYVLSQDEIQIAISVQVHRMESCRLGIVKSEERPVGNQCPLPGVP